MPPPRRAIGERHKRATGALRDARRERTCVGHLSRVCTQRARFRWQMRERESRTTTAAANTGGHQRCARGQRTRPAVRTMTTRPSRLPREVGRSALRDQERARACLAARAIACAPRRVAERPGWGGSVRGGPSEKGSVLRRRACAPRRSPSSRGSSCTR